MKDALKTFYERALLFKDSYKLPSDFLKESLEIITKNFTEDWINEQIKKQQRGSAFPYKIHPIANLITIAGGQQLVKFLELAIYLKNLDKIENFLDVINNLKDEKQYDHAFTQLSYAYRFKLLGAKSLKFEPKYGERLGDISFTYDNNNYMTECYVPIMENEGSYKHLDFIIGNIFDAIKTTPKAIFIKLKKPIDVNDRKKIKQLILECIKSVEINKEQEKKIEDDLLEITVKDILKLDPDYYLPKPEIGGLYRGYQDADVSIAQKFIYKKDMEKYILGEKIGNYKNVILIWIPDAERKELFIIKRLRQYLKKVKGKIEHIPRNSYEKMILIISIPFVIYRANHVLLVNKMLKNIKINSKLTIMLTSRMWTNKNRYIYTGTLLCGSTDELPESINNLEAILDILSCWK
jgi:hypothetical protein